MASRQSISHYNAGIADNRRINALHDGHQCGRSTAGIKAVSFIADCGLGTVRIGPRHDSGDLRDIDRKRGSNVNDDGRGDRNGKRSGDDDDRQGRGYDRIGIDDCVNAELAGLVDRNGAVRATYRWSGRKRSA